MEAARRAHLQASYIHDIYPARADPVRWRGEIDARAPTAALLLKEAFERPFEAVALHEHSGAFRDAWTAVGVRAASVADRPSATRPAPGATHFVCDVETWRAKYPWSIPLATANPDCHCAACLLYTSPSPRD